MNPDRDVAILESVFRYYVLTRAQVVRLHFRPGPTRDRIARKRLQHLAGEKLLNVARLRYSPDATAATHVYYPSRRGAEFLAARLGDESYLARTCQCPQQYCLFHWIRLTDRHLMLDRAVALQTEACVPCWYSEWDVVNPAESVHRPEKRFRLYTLLQEESKRLVCAPDAAFLMTAGGHGKVFYVEEDRHTESAERYVNAKVKGYAELHARRGHRRHFPEATADDFTVLMFSPDETRRKALCTAMKGKPGERLWRFCSVAGLTAETLLHEPVFHATQGDPGSLLRTKPHQPPAPGALPDGLPEAVPSGATGGRP
jgi:hypothetical protein